MIVSSPFFLCLKNYFAALPKARPQYYSDRAPSALKVRDGQLTPVSFKQVSQSEKISFVRGMGFLSLPQGLSSRFSPPGR